MTADRRYRFSPSLRLTAFVLIFLPIVSALSIWQWQRAGEAARFEAHLERMAAGTPRPLAAVTESGPDADMMPVRLEGRFLAAGPVWRDNRTWRGRAGYELLAPFADPTVDADAVLVNLGWVAGDPDRSRLPEVTPPPGTLVLNGQLAPHRPPATVFGPVVEEMPAGLRVQRVDVEVIGEALGLRLHPRIVVADSRQVGVQTWNFQPQRVTAARHRGYALQWFGLAVVLIIGWIAASIQREPAS